MPAQLLTAPTAEPIALAAAKAHLRVTITDDDAYIPGLIAAARQAAEAITQRQMLAARWKLTLDCFPGLSLPGVAGGRPVMLPLDSVVYPNASSLVAHSLLLPHPPILQVVSIQYLDTNGVQQTMPSTDYIVDLTSEPARITPVFGKIWPIALPQIGSVTVTYDAGFAAPFTADATANTITVRGWKPLAVNDTLRLSNSGGALPAPLLPLVDYYVQSVPSAGVYTLSATAGGAAIDLTDAGSGLNFVGAVPEGILSWMMLRLGSFYENREEAAHLSRGSVQDLSFVAGLLDPYRVMVF